MCDDDDNIQIIKLVNVYVAEGKWVIFTNPGAAVPVKEN